MTDPASKSAIEALLIERVGERLAFNQGAYGTPWTGEAEDTRFLVADAAEALTALMNDQRARLYRAITDGLMEIADELQERTEDGREASAMFHGDDIHPEVAAIRDAVDNVYGKLYFNTELPRCHECGSQVGTHHGPSCRTGGSRTIGSSVVTGLVQIDDCLTPTDGAEASGV